MCDMSVTPEEIFRALRERVYGDPDLQARLFALDDPGEFVAVLQNLAQAHGHVLDDARIVQAMREGNRAWLERRLP
jgi:hypothetical protein